MESILTATPLRIALVSLALLLAGCLDRSMDDGPSPDSARDVALAGLSGIDEEAPFGADADSPRACTDDALEDNDVALAATAVGAPGALAGLASCPGDLDWFEFALLDGQTLTLTAEFTHAEGDINLLLKNPLGANLATASTTTNDEQIVFAAVGDQTVRLRLELANDLGQVDGNSYALDVSVLDPTACIDDLLEDDDVALSATSVAVPGSYGGPVSCPSDLDWYEIDLLAGDQLTAISSFTHAEGDINLTLKSVVGGNLGFGWSTTDNERIDYTAASDQTVRLRIEMAADAGSYPGNEYELDLAILNPTVCSDDSDEDNDTALTATPLAAPGFYDGRMLCDADLDWYEFDLLAGQELTLDVRFSHLQGDIDVWLKDISGVVLDYGVSTDDDEQVSYVAPSDLTVRLRLELEEELGWFAGNEYSLDVSIVDPLACIDDVDEDDDTALTATVLPGRGATFGHAVCPSDADWFEMQLAAGDRFDVDAVFAHAEGDIDLQLRDVWGGVLDTGSTTTDNESVTYTATGDELVRLRVQLTSDAGSFIGNEYDLQVSLVNLSVCVDDEAEDNDSAPTSTTLPGQGPFGPYVTCDGDLDWYEVDMLSGETLTLDVLFDHSQGDIDVLLKDLLGANLDTGLSTDDNEQVTWTATADETVRARVVLATDTGDAPGNYYSLNVGLVVGGPAECVDDANEDNDGDLQATLWTSTGLYTDLVVCNLDWDWYEFDLVTGETVTFDVLFSHAEGDVDAELQDTLGNVLDTSASSTDDEVVSYTATGDDKVYLVVELTQDLGSTPGNTYEVDVSVSSGPECIDDAEEHNDTALTATVLPGAGYNTDLVSCDGDMDWFELALLADETLTIDALFAHAEGDIDIFLKDVTGSWLDWSQSQTDDEQVTFTALSDMVVRLQLVLTQDLGATLGNDYDLDVVITP
jgi:hypothetical protein